MAKSSKQQAKYVEVLDCPFCGKSPKVHTYPNGYSAIECDYQHCTGGNPRVARTSVRYAVAAWNKRKPAWCLRVRIFQHKAWY